MEQIKVKVRYEKCNKGHTPQKVVVKEEGLPFYVFFKDVYGNYYVRKLDSSGKNFLYKLNEEEEPTDVAYFYFPNYTSAKKFVDDVVEEIRQIKKKYEAEVVVGKEEEYIIQ